ncbi:MAG: dihydroorotate dehydrogenase [Candidatus Omnitrophica bacterium]|nr:dihydroorotate dehydrogenase [Candidatus Omnitrophota bacterium]
MEPKISISLGRLKLKNPVMIASGTFGYAREFSDFFDLKKLGAIVTKTITLRARQGNLPPRTCETPAGMLNSVGLENPGIDAFIREKLPLLAKTGVPIIVSIASEAGWQEFVELARRLDKIKAVAALELNISCPNISRRSIVDSPQATKLLISQDSKATYDLVKTVRKATRKTLITKLSPNVTDIAEIAVAAEAAGSDAVSLINTLTGMSIDAQSRRSKVAAGIAGLSGPAVRPIAVRMVWEAYQKIKIPIIGMGGIIDDLSALEFLIAGATAVSVGTANFVYPRVTIEIIEGVRKYLRRNRIKDIKYLSGSLNL